MQMGQVYLVNELMVTTRFLNPFLSLEPTQSDHPPPRDHLNKDDVVATHFLHLTRLSSADPDDEGFLPTFGPAYVCFYGSPREFSTYNMDLEGLDKGLVGHR